VFRPTVIQVVPFLGRYSAVFLRLAFSFP
jgi:hypothetical protein